MPRVSFNDLRTSGNPSFCLSMSDALLPIGKDATARRQMDGERGYATPDVTHTTSELHPGLYHSAARRRRPERYRGQDFRPDGIGVGREQHHGEQRFRADDQLRRNRLT
jgi:hypothetical protein